MIESRIRVVVAEDNPTDALLLREALATAGNTEFELTFVDCVLDCVNLLKNERFQAVLIDLGLPDSSGLDTLRILRPHIQDAVIIVLTGLEDEETAIQAVKLGAEDYLMKSQVPTTMLGRIIRYAIERRQLKRTLELKREREAEEKEELYQDLERQVTERTSELKSANAELESFSYSVAHDLRAPIRQIAGFSQILADECGEYLQPEPRRYLRKIQDGAIEMGELVDDLLNLSRVSRQSLSRRPTNLNRLIDVAREQLESECKDRDIEWIVDPLWTAKCDSSLVRQVFVNLLSNAVKFTRLRGRAVIRVGWNWGRIGGASDATSETGADVQIIYVRDNGAGFNMAYAGKLFGAFQRLHRREDFDGTGIGLANVQRIVHKHGGQIWAESVPDQGATFFFTLPDQPEPDLPHLPHLTTTA